MGRQENSASKDFDYTAGMSIAYPAHAG